MPVPLEEPPEGDPRENVLRAWRLLNGYDALMTDTMKFDPGIPNSYYLVRAPRGTFGGPVIP
jgi:hypothetical protein